MPRHLRVSRIHQAVKKAFVLEKLNMEIFRDTHFDFLGRKWWFILPSLILTFAGLVSLLLNGGPRYSIDFSGGAIMDVRWEGTAPIERIRTAVSSRLSAVSVVAAHDLAGSNEVLVSAQTPAQEDLTTLRRTIVDSLSTVDGRFSILSFEAVGPQIGADLRRQALLADRQDGITPYSYTVGEAEAGNAGEQVRRDKPACCRG
jgi:preprotein translocase subunit SecF